ncbi:MAG: nucleoside-diphosphate kinase [Candidatus Berkelbacteria bacterium]|nr:nucleoside-diphosphate kinase [Candidatus Berkelbacteria bacterium]
MTTKNPKEERTCVIVKPDGVKRGLTGEIIGKIEQRGLKIAALSMVWPTRKDIDEHYPKDEAWMARLGEKTLFTYQKYNIDSKKELGTNDELKIGKMVRGWLIDYLTAGPVVKMVVQGVHAVDMIRKLVGNSCPNLAEMGTIRGDYSVDSPVAANKDHRAIHNLVHASETPEEAEHEIDFWFKQEEIHEYKRSEEEMMF